MSASLKKVFNAILETGAPITLTGLLDKPSLAGLPRPELTAALDALVLEGSIERKPMPGARSIYSALKQERTAVIARADKPLEPVLPPSGGKREHTAAGLREALFDVLDGLRAGRIDPKQAIAAATVAQAVIKSAELQLTFARLKEQNLLKDLPLLQLGHVDH